jgi:hypothetical protein
LNWRVWGRFPGMWLPCSVCGLAVVLVLKARAPSPVVVCHPVGCGRMADRYCCRGRDQSRDSGEAGMGVLTDYFRAPSVAAVLEQMAERDGGPLVSEGSESSAFDGSNSRASTRPWRWAVWSHSRWTGTTAQTSSTIG